MLLMLDEYKCRFCLDIFFLLGSLTGQPLDGDRLVHSFCIEIFYTDTVRFTENQVLRLRPHNFDIL
jgi:hypothetical protein